MDILWIVLIVWGVSAAFYSFRMVLKYFQYLEGQIRNGTIITNGIAAGLIWPITFLLDGFRGIWQEIGPVKVTAVEAANLDQPVPIKPPTLSEIVAGSALENLGG